MNSIVTESFTNEQRKKSSLQTSGNITAQLEIQKTHGFSKRARVLGIHFFQCLILLLFNSCSKLEKRKGFDETLLREDTLMITNMNEYCTLIDSLKNDSYPKYKHKLKIKQKFPLLGNLNFDEGHWVCVFESFYNDSFLSNGAGRYILLDKYIMNSMKKDWIVTYTNDGCCTPEAMFSFYKDNRLVFRCGAYIEEGNSDESAFEGNDYSYTPCNYGLIRKYFPYFKYCNEG